MTDDEGHTQNCLRCGYDLRGIHNSQPCPECGLLAERSRRVSDELHDTRPKWLRSLAMGVWLILLAITALWPIAMELLRQSVDNWRTPSALSEFLQGVIAQYGGWDLSAVVLFIGVLLLTVPENYEPADHADRRLRWLLRRAAAMPLAAMIILHANLIVADHFQMFYSRRREWFPLEIAAAVVGTIGCIPLPLLLFIRLRGLAKRAHSAHLAEHCLIVGIGASLTIAYAPIHLLLVENGNEWFGQYWSARSNSWLVINLLLTTFGTLFVLWSLYLLLRFAIAFAKASRQLNQKWKANDASVISA